MFTKLKHNLTILAAKKLLAANKTKKYSSTKCTVSLVAGAYIFHKGLKNIAKHPLIGLQEAFLGGFLVYDAVSALGKDIPDRKANFSRVRRNQIRANDPESLLLLSEAR